MNISNLADRQCCPQGEEARQSILTALSGGTHLLKELIATARKLSEGEARLAELIDAIKAALEWCASERNPRPSLLKLSWACCQDVSDWYSVKVCRTCRSKACNSFNANDGGADLAMWTNLLKPPQKHSKITEGGKSQAAPGRIVKWKQQHIGRQ